MERKELGRILSFVGTLLVGMAALMWWAGSGDQSWMSRAILFFAAGFILAVAGFLLNALSKPKPVDNTKPEWAR